MSKAKKGDRVRIHFTGRLEDGTVFESTRRRGLLEFEVGSDDIIPGVSKTVEGMRAGDTKHVALTPEEGFGDHDSSLVQKVPLDMLPEDVAVGASLQAVGEDSETPIVLWIKEMGEDYALIDPNHPLSGQNLEVDIEMVSVYPRH